jgi:hypothetical protein
MYPRQTVDLALALSRCGVLDRENAEICGVSIAAIRHWRYGGRRNAQTERKRRSVCPRCDGRALDSRAYSYLLGLYLGDGCLTRSRRDVYALSVICCDAWPGLIVAAKSALATVMRTSSVFCTGPACSRSTGRAGSTSAK